MNKLIQDVAPFYPIGSILSQNIESSQYVMNAMQWDNPDRTVLPYLSMKDPWGFKARVLVAGTLVGAPVYGEESLFVRANTNTATAIGVFQTYDWVSLTTGSQLQIGFGHEHGDTYSYLAAKSAGGSAWNNLVLQSGGGCVGILETNPTQPLTVKGTIWSSNSASTTSLILSGSGSNLQVTHDGSAIVTLYNSATSGGFNFKTSAVAAALTILNGGNVNIGGNVGIGTPSPIAGNLLCVGAGGTGATNAWIAIDRGSGAAQAQLRFYSNSVLKAAVYSANTAPADGLVFYTTGADFYFNGGNVGIGTTSPSSLSAGGTFTTLNVHKASGYGLLTLTTDSTASSSNVGQVLFGSTGSSGHQISAAITSTLRAASGTNSIGDLQFYTNAAAGVSLRMTIDKGGNVGIGISPSRLLHVGGSAQIDDGIAAPSTAAAGAVTNRYGGATNFCGDPNAWLRIYVSGTAYKIPLYT